MRKKPLDHRVSEQLGALGVIIRGSRRGRLSLEDLAARAGISAGQLSQIENGTGNPTVEMLIRIAGALDLGVTDLIERQPAAPTHVVRAGSPRPYRVLGTEHDVHLMTPGLHHQLTMSRTVLQPGDRHTSPLHQGSTLFYVVKGELEVRKANVTHHLRTHDSLLVAHPFDMTAAYGVPVELIATFRGEGS